MPALLRIRQVVVVEDDVSMNQAIERILRLSGFAPLTYLSAEKMLEAGCPADAVCFIFDVHLPGITGFELREQLARNGKQAAVIFISAYDEPESRGRARRAGASAFLTKPFSGHDLMAAVERAVAA